MKKKKPSKAKSKAAAKRAKERKEKHTKLLTKHCMLHFARTHDDCDRTGGGDQCNAYNRKLKAAPAAMNQPFEAAVHHILPVSAVVAFMKVYKDKDAELDNIASVYAQMEWCINTTDNLMWLPYFPAYQRHLNDGKPSSAPSSMAAHNFDHNPHYNDLVIDKLKPFWREIAAQKPTDDCEKAKEIVKTLNAEIPIRKTNLSTRPTQPILDRAHALKVEGKRVSDMEKDTALRDWWLTFSMAPESAKERSHKLLRSKPPKRNVMAAIKRATEAGG